MEKLIGTLLILGFLPALALSSDFKVEVKKIWNLPFDYRINKKKVGGLSGCAFAGNRFYFVSDDRGQEGGPRIISFAYEAEQQEINFQKSEVIFVKLEKNEKVLDLEGIGLASKDRFLLSSEGDLDQKPRLNPSIFWVNEKGERLKTVTFPENYLSEKTGKQTKGIQTNLAFEGLVVDLEYQKWAALLEAPLMQDPSELKLVESAIESEKFDHVFSYPVATPYYSPNFLEKPTTAYFGATDILYLTKDSFLLLERGVTLSNHGIGFWSQLCEAVKENQKTLFRSCFYSMNEDQRLKVDLPMGANFEGLCWVDKQKKIFLTVSDNNFSKNQKTFFILYQLN